MAGKYFNFAHQLQQTDGVLFTELLQNSVNKMITAISNQNNHLKLSVAYLFGSRKLNPLPSSVQQQHSWLASKTLKIACFGTISASAVYLLIKICISKYVNYSNRRAYDKELNLVDDHLPPNAADEKISFENFKGKQINKVIADIIDNLKSNSDKTTSLSAIGGKLPKTVLLLGKAGSGKTLIARAIAGEQKVPIFYIDSLEINTAFDVIDKFKHLIVKAKHHKPAIVFIDNIDMIDIDKCKVQQIFAEIDTCQSGGIVFFATARSIVDSLKQLCESHWFDELIDLDSYLSIEDRIEIWNLYLSSVKVSNDVIVELIAKKKKMTGKAVQKTVQKAVRFAMSDGTDQVSMKHLLLSTYVTGTDVIAINSSSIMSTAVDLHNIAVHECGHAIVAYFTLGSFPFNYVTIEQFSDALGHAHCGRPRQSSSKKEILAEIDISLGGRAAEEIFLGVDGVTDGCSSDLIEANIDAEYMIKKYGMSDRLGLRRYTIEPEKCSKEVNAAIDNEIKLVLEKSYERAKNILSQHRAAHQRLTQVLVAEKFLNAEQIKKIIEETPNSPPTA